MAIVDTREKREQRHKLIVEARAVLDKADEEKRSLTAEDRGQYGKIWSEVETLKAEIDDIETRNDLEREEIAETLRVKRDKEEQRKQKGEDEETTVGPRGSEEYRSAFKAYLIGKPNEVEERALSAGTATEGGFLYASEQFVDDLIANVVDETIYRQVAMQMRITTADSLGVPTLDTRMSAAAWTSELGPASRDTAMAFGKRALAPHPLAKEVPVSRTLLRKAPNAVGIVQGELARVIAEANENGFMTGSGAQQPLGIFTASSDGISTSRDVATDNTATEVRFDNLKRVKYTLKQQYHPRASWIFHRDVVSQIARLKDGDGRYLWQDSVVQGEPDRLLGFPARMSEFAPNTMTAGLYVGILGDHSNYWIVDALDLQVEREQHLLTRTNQDLFIVRMETDGAPVREEAFVRVKLGT